MRKWLWYLILGDSDRKRKCRPNIRWRSKIVIVMYPEPSNFWLPTLWFQLKDTLNIIHCHYLHLKTFEPVVLPAPTKPWSPKSSISLRLSCNLRSRHSAVTSQLDHRCPPPHKYAYHLMDQFQYHLSPLPSHPSLCRRFWYRSQFSRSRQRHASPRLVKRLSALLGIQSRLWLGWIGRQPLMAWTQRLLQFLCLSPRQKARQVLWQNRKMLSAF